MRFSVSVRMERERRNTTRMKKMYCTLVIQDSTSARDSVKAMLILLV